MEIIITDEFKAICLDIIKEKKSDKEWALIESDDMFQTQSYCGGYDADEEAFCFSFYNENNDEYWFQINLKEVERISNNELTKIIARPAE